MSVAGGFIGDVSFESTAVRWAGPAAWIFVLIPADHAQSAAGRFGRVPVVATVDGVTRRTSVSRDRESDPGSPVGGRGGVIGSSAMP